MPGWITLSSPYMVGAGALALSMANLSGPVRRPVVGSKYSITWKSLTWTWRMLIVVVVDEPPLLDRVEPRLDQRHVGECAAIERIYERFRVLPTRHVVEKSAGYQDLPLDVRHDVGEIEKGRVGAKRLTFDEGRRHAGTFRGLGSG